MAAKKTTKRNTPKTRAPKAPKASEAQVPPTVETDIQQMAEAEGSTPSETEVPALVDHEVPTPAEAEVPQAIETEALELTEADLATPAEARRSLEVEVPAPVETDVPPPAETETAAAATPTEAQPTRWKQRTKVNGEPKAKKPSALDAAARVLGETGQPMSSQELIKTMAEKGYWSSPKGQTPHATLYSAILREINVKGAEARFQKTERHLRKAYALMVGALGQLKRWEAAWETCQEGLRKFPQDAELRFRKGVLLHERGRLPEAVSLFRSKTC